MCVYIYIYTYIHIHIHTRICIRIYMSIYIYMYTYKHMYMYTYLYSGHIVLHCKAWAYDGSRWGLHRQGRWFALCTSTPSALQGRGATLDVLDSKSNEEIRTCVLLFWSSKPCAKVLGADARRSGLEDLVGGAGVRRVVFFRWPAVARLRKSRLHNLACTRPSKE